MTTHTTSVNGLEAWDGFEVRLCYSAASTAKMLYCNGKYYSTEGPTRLGIDWY